MLSDKEIGKLWLIYNQSKQAEHSGLALIRKLVEERIRRYDETSHETRTSNARGEALRDFGIAPKDFEGEP